LVLSVYGRGVGCVGDSEQSSSPSSPIVYISFLHDVERSPCFAIRPTASCNLSLSFSFVHRHFACLTTLFSLYCSFELSLHCARMSPISFVLLRIVFSALVALRRVMLSFVFLSHDPSTCVNAFYLPIWDCTLCLLLISSMVLTKSSNLVSPSTAEDSFSLCLLVPPRCGFIWWRVHA